MIVCVINKGIKSHLLLFSTLLLQCFLDSQGEKERDEYLKRFEVFETKTLRVNALQAAYLI